MKDYYAVMVHFYRGEVGRIMLWRQRLDVTTNWAIAASTGIITYGLSHAEVTHLVFLFANIVCLFLLIIESRRYRYYDAFRARRPWPVFSRLCRTVSRCRRGCSGRWACCFPAP